MISLSTMFWFMIMLFALIGSLRGWTKEVITTAGVVLSLFSLNQFGSFLIGFIGGATSGSELAVRQQFYLLTIIHLVITFFSYQGPTIAGSRVGERLRVRDNFQDKLLGFLVGGFNGYLIVGAVLAFLEYRVAGPGNWVRLDPGVQYPFDPSVLVRPDLAAAGASILANLPLPLFAPYLPFLVVVVFLFVIVVMI